MSASASRQVADAGVEGVGAQGSPVFVTATPHRDAFIHHDHALVEITRSGAVRISGVSRANGHPVFLAPPLLASLPQAILAAHQWAEEHGVAHVFLLDRTAG